MNSVFLSFEDDGEIRLDSPRVVVVVVVVVVEEKREIKLDSPRVVVVVVLRAFVRWAVLRKGSFLRCSERDCG
jgi:hypothetical protein